MLTCFHRWQATEGHKGKEEGRKDGRKEVDLVEASHSSRQGVSSRQSVVMLLAELLARDVLDADVEEGGRCEPSNI